MSKPAKSKCVIVAIHYTGESGSDLPPYCVIKLTDTLKEKVAQIVKVLRENSLYSAIPMNMATGANDDTFMKYGFASKNDLILTRTEGDKLSSTNQVVANIDFNALPDADQYEYQFEFSGVKICHTGYISITGNDSDTEAEAWTGWFQC